MMDLPFPRVLKVLEQQHIITRTTSQRTHDTTAQTLPAQSSTTGHDPNHISFITPYGLLINYQLQVPNLQANRTNHPTNTPKFTFHLQHHHQPTPSPSTPEPLAPRLRIFPDYTTSYLWQDTTTCPSTALPDVYHLDDDDILAWFPTLAPHFFAWRERYEQAFEMRGMHLGTVEGEVFEDVEMRVGWLAEGFLLGVGMLWAREGGGKVEGVSYEPGEKTWVLEGAGVGRVFGEFLGEMEGVVDGGLRRNKG